MIYNLPPDYIVGVESQHELSTSAAAAAAAAVIYANLATLSTDEAIHTYDT